MDAEHVTIESQEDGFWMFLATDDGDVHSFRIQNADLDTFYAQVKERIGSYLAERDSARHAFLCNPDESGGYDTSNPKHPDFHSVHADIWDAREGK